MKQAKVVRHKKAARRISRGTSARVLIDEARSLQKPKIRLVTNATVLAM